MPQLIDRLAVCSWSLQPSTPADLITKLKQIGLHRVQLAIDPLREGGAWADTAAQFKAAGITVASGMMMTVGEDYTTPQTIQATGGEQCQMPRGMQAGPTFSRWPKSLKR